MMCEIVSILPSDTGITLLLLNRLSQKNYNKKGWPEESEKRDIYKKSKEKKKVRRRF